MGKFSIFMTAGTLDLNFYRLFNLALELNDNEEIGEIVVQGVGAKDFFSNSNILAYDFLDKKEMNEFIDTSDLVISHCGVGSIMTSIKQQKPTILIPRRKCFNEHFDDHQMQIFEEVKSNKLFYCLEEKKLKIEDIEKFYINSKDLLSTCSDKLENLILQNKVKDYFIKLGVLCE